MRTTWIRVAWLSVLVGLLVACGGASAGREAAPANGEGAAPVGVESDEQTAGSPQLIEFYADW